MFPPSEGEVLSCLIRLNLFEFQWGEETLLVMELEPVADGSSACCASLISSLPASDQGARDAAGSGMLRLNELEKQVAGRTGKRARGAER